MIYFDNAATSFPKPPCVIADLNRCIRRYCGNPGRSSHALSLRAAEEIYEAREEIASLLSVNSPESVVFTYNATHALNLAIKTLITKNCHVLTSDFEHNSVIRPLEALHRRLNAEYSIFDTSGNIEESIKAAIREDTRAIVCSVASNVTGDEIDLEILSKIARECELILIIDASQAIGHKKIDLERTPCDALCAPGHKALFGIQGSGFVYFKDRMRRESFIEGGSGSDSRSREMPLLLPEGYEGGTLATPAIVSLKSGIGYIKRVGIDAIQGKISLLTRLAEEGLSDIKGLTVYKSGHGVLSFNYRNYPSSLIASALDQNGICTRAGLHCAPSVHERLGTIEQGTIRVSFSCLNTEKEIEAFLYNIGRVVSELNL